MISDPIEFERARAHWWQIYFKCQQMRSDSDTYPYKAVSVAEMLELRSPCETAQQITREVLWSYLNRCRDREQISLEDGPNAGLRITSLCLWAYLGYWLLESKTLRMYQSGQSFTAQEQAEFYQQASTFFMQLLRQIRADIPGESLGFLGLEELEGISYIQFARSLIFLLSEYCHLDVSMSRVLDVETHLRNAISSEAHLYLTRGLYRDHIFHVIDVCLLGLFLLNCHFSERQTTLLSLISELIHGSSGMYHDDNVIQNWFLAALFHDVGYSLEAEEQSRDDFQEESTNQGPREEWPSTSEIELNKLLSIHRGNLAELKQRKAQHGIDFPIRLIHEIEAEQEEIRRLEMQLEHPSMRRNARPAMRRSHTRETEIRGKIGSDHGVRSYEYVKQILETLPGDSETRLKEFKPALKAIRKHNLMEEVITFSEEPLSFLLVLCDELQEWGRPRVASVPEFREALISQIIFSDPSSLPTNRLLEYLFVGVELDEESRCGIIPGRALHFCLLYHDATEKQFEPLAIWLLKLYNFQRMQINEDKLKITVALRNPVCEDLRRIDSSDTCEFNLLKIFRRKRRKWLELQDWIENEDVVKWEAKRENKPGNRIEEENVILHLNKFTGARLLHDDPSRILYELSQWRRDYIDGRR